MTINVFVISVLFVWGWLFVGSILYIILPSEIREEHKRLIVFGGPATLAFIIIFLPLVIAWEALTEAYDE